MSARDIRLHHLQGRKVHDVNGAFIGRIHELCAEIELHPHGNDYVVREFRIGSIGMLEFAGGSYFIRELLHSLHLVRPEKYVVPWEQLDLSDPERPRLTIPREMVTRTATN